MITKEKIQIYRKYGEDIDMWARIAPSEEKSYV